jgi:hypothetical protein
MALHGQIPGLRGGKRAGLAGQFGVQGVVFVEFAGKETVGETGLFRGPKRGQQIGRALPPIGRLLFGDLHKPDFGRGAQQRVEPTQADTQCTSGCALGRIRCRVQLAQKTEEQVFVRQVECGVGHVRIRIEFVHG